MIQKRLLMLFFLSISNGKTETKKKSFFFIFSLCSSRTARQSARVRCSSFPERRTCRSGTGRQVITIKINWIAERGQNTSAARHPVIILCYSNRYRGDAALEAFSAFSFGSLALARFNSKHFIDLPISFYSQNNFTRIAGKEMFINFYILLCASRTTRSSVAQRKRARRWLD